MILKVKQVVTNAGYRVGANGSVSISFAAKYSELTNTIKLQQLLNNDVEIKVKVPTGTGKPQVLNLGNFRVKRTTIDDDGESKVEFNGITDYIEMDNLNKLPLNSDDLKEFTILVTADIESEDGEEDAEED